MPPSLLCINFSLRPNVVSLSYRVVGTKAGGRHAPTNARFGLWLDPKARRQRLRHFGVLLIVGFAHSSVIMVFLNQGSMQVKGEKAQAITLPAKSLSLID